jgi:hypothetical protein
MTAMPYQIGRVEKQASLAEREEALTHLPLVRSVLTEIEERSRRLLFLEAACAALSHSPADSTACQLHEREANVQRHELARAERELAQLGCTIVACSPLAIQMLAPSGARMLWILG